MNRMFSRDFGAGALLLVIGAGAVLEGRTYDVGTLTRMGPGWFPVALGVILAGVGAAIMLSFALRLESPDAPPEAERLDVRGSLCIVAGVGAFIAAGAWFGLLPATFLSVFIACMGDRRSTVRSALVLAVALSFCSVIVFHYALQLPMPLIRW